MESLDSVQVTVKHLVSWNSIIPFGQQRSLDALNRTQPSGLATDRPPCSHFRWQDYWAVTATAGCSGDWGGLCPAALGTWSVGGWLQRVPACSSRMGAWGASAHNGPLSTQTATHTEWAAQRGGADGRKRSIVARAQMSRLKVWSQHTWRSSHRLEEWKTDRMKERQWFLMGSVYLWGEQTFTEAWQKVHSVHLCVILTNETLYRCIGWRHNANSWHF